MAYDKAVQYRDRSSSGIMFNNLMLFLTIAKISFDKLKESIMNNYEIYYYIAFERLRPELLFRHNV